jgi:hypothetical protein
MFQCHIGAFGELISYGLVLFYFLKLVQIHCLLGLSFLDFLYLYLFHVRMKQKIESK